MSGDAKLSVERDVEVLLATAAKGWGDIGCEEVFPCPSSNGEYAFIQGSEQF